MSSSLLVSREETTGANGCIICSTVPDCPQCAKNERCVQSTQTCFQCPKTYCKPLSTASVSGSETNIGGVAGGVIGGVLTLVISGYLFYRFYLKKKLAFKKVERQGEFYDFDDDAEINFHHRFVNDVENSELEKPSSRSSFATVFTRASNIIPIAYIPGVTIGTNPSSKSNIRASTVSDAGTFDSDIIGDRFSNASIVQNPSLTTTAIRAKPRLITVNNSYDGTTEDNGEDRDSIPKTAVGARQLGGVKSVRIEKRKNNLGLQEDLIEEEDEEEDERDQLVQNNSSFKDTINQKDATVVTDANSSSNILQELDEYDPFIIDDDLDEDSDFDNESIRSRGSNGSVILEVEMDTAPHDPFDDSFRST